MPSKSYFSQENIHKMINTLAYKAISEIFISKLVNFVRLINPNTVISIVK